MYGGTREEHWDDEGNVYGHDDHGCSYYYSAVAGGASYDCDDEACMNWVEENGFYIGTIT